jgi:hypothetical protein
MDTTSPSLQTLMTAALTLTLAWYIAYWYVNKRGVMAGAGAAVAKADKDEAIRDEFGVRPQSRAGLLAPQSSASKSRGELLRRLCEHRRPAVCCIFPASSTIRARRP